VKIKHLITIASKQVWPQVLTVKWMNPERLILLHSGNEEESKGPAQRLKEFLHATGVMDKSRVELELVSHMDFTEILTQLRVSTSRYGLLSTNAVFNFTGGNKLMATAAFHWATLGGFPAVYLERGNQLIWFDTHAQDIQTRIELLDSHIADELDAVELLICQLGPAVLQSRGERLSLSESGRNGHVRDVQACLGQNAKAKNSNLDFRKWLVIEGDVVQERREGDALEYAVAVILLKLGVPSVYRSVEIKPTVKTNLLEGELDLVFNWNGRLWVVDCKDKASGKMKLDNLQTALIKEGIIMNRIQKYLDALDMDLGEKDIKILREDLQQIAEVGGLLGNVLAVRSAGLPKQAVEYAQSRRPRVEIVYKDKLLAELQRLLLPAT